MRPNPQHLHAFPISPSNDIVSLTLISHRRHVYRRRGDNNSRTDTDTKNRHVLKRIGGGFRVGFSSVRLRLHPEVVEPFPTVTLPRSRQ
jgi:hypothetical protein